MKVFAFTTCATIARTAILGIFVTGAFPQSATLCTEPSTCSPERSRIVENLQGALDGDNVTFSITRSPASDVRVFRNGLPLLPGLEYTLRNKTVIVLQKPPAPGDMLQASYIPDLISKTLRINIQRDEPYNIQGMIAGALDMANAACREALESEEVTADDARHNGGSVQTADGLGDGPLASPFVGEQAGEAFFNSSPPVGRLTNPRLGVAPTSHDAYSKAIIMLEQRLGVPAPNMAAAQGYVTPTGANKMEP